MVVPNEDTWYDPVPQYDNITHVHVFNVDITVGVRGCAFIFYFNSDFPITWFYSPHSYL